MLLSIALILIFGLALGELAGLLRLPKLTGMIAAGILLGSLGWLDPALLGISADLRKIALIIILTRAGLNLELSDLKKCGRPALLLSFVPAACEIVGVTLLAQLLLGLDIAEAATMGSVLAAVSPAVIVPKMLKLMEEKRGTDKQIPQMILAGASMDDVFVIVMFSVFSGLCAGGEVSAVSIVNIPVSILLGAAVGAVCGVLMALLFRKLHMRDSVKVILVMSLAFLLVTLEDFLPDFIGFSGLVAVMTAGIALRQREPERAVRISAKYSKLWTAAELMLFVLVGAEVDLNSIGGIWLPVLGVIIGALAPMRGSVPLPAENPALPERTAVLHARLYSEGNGAGCHRRSPTRDGACMRKRDTFRSSACDTRNSRGGSVPDRPHRTPAAEKRGVKFHKLMQVTTSGTLAAL